MRRALELATLGQGTVSPNPLVGCVIVHQNEASVERIIGEGWHRQYGGPHAEVNAVRSVKPEDEHLLSDATVYVTLEPCAHWGKTPPCADLLVEKRVKHVIICNPDPFPLVDGRGIEKLRAAGISVEVGLLNEEGRQMNRRFFTSVEKKRPHILLKWAETADGFIAGPKGAAVKISGDLSHRLVHRWRSEYDAIMVGTNTARSDNPRLNVRLWSGRNPTRVVVDKRLELSTDLHVFDGSQPTVVYHLSPRPPLLEGRRGGAGSIFSPSPSFEERGPGAELRPGEVTYQQLTGSPDRPALPLLTQLLNNLHERRIQSLLVEGGTALLQAFIDAGLWDEMAVFKSQLVLGTGIAAPLIRGRLVATETVGDDELRWFRP